jgi:hypothetical protein
VKILRNSLAVLCACAVILMSILAYHIVNYSPDDGIYRDGLGRKLEASPPILRIIPGREKYWAGWVWLAVDVVCFVGGVSLTFALAKWD